MKWLKQEVYFSHITVQKLVGFPRPLGILFPWCFLGIQITILVLLHSLFLRGLPSPAHSHLCCHDASAFLPLGKEKGCMEGRKFIFIDSIWNWHISLPLTYLSSMFIPGSKSSPYWVAVSPTVFRGGLYSKEEVGKEDSRTRSSPWHSWLTVPTSKLTD